MRRVLKGWGRATLNRYVQRLCRQEFEHQEFRRFNERPVELSFVFRKVAEIYPRTVLDVGTGTTALPYLLRNCGPLVTATDNVRDYWPQGMVNRHYHVLDDDIRTTRLTTQFQMVTCISVLEHIEEADQAMQNMFRLLTSTGSLLVTFPYNETSYVRNVYDLPGSSYGAGEPYITQSYSRQELDRWIRANDGVIVEQEYWQFWEGEHWTVGRQLIPPREVTRGERHQLTCIHLTRRR